MPEGGRAIEPGIIARAALRVASALNEFFGPNVPQQVNAPPGTPPRQFDYPTGYNLNIQPQNLEPITFDQMRSLADSFDMVRLCIETRKDQLAKMKWQFALKKDLGEKPGEYKKRNAGDDRLGALTDFFQSPDKEHTWNEWVRMLMEDMLVLDAPVICPVSDADGTLWTKGEPYGLEIIDGSTIARKIDQLGRTPKPPLVAYQQIVKGLPAVDFTSDQLIYKPRNVRAHKFFGFSPVEQIILTINIGMRRQIHLLNYYTEGNVPEALAMVPPTWSADQITEFQEWFDAKLSGTKAARRRITFIPEAGTVQFTRDPNLKDELDDWLARIVCFAFSMSPQPFIKQMNRATAETSVEQAKQEGLEPLTLYLEDTVNWIVQKYFGYNDIEFSFRAEKDANPVEQTEIMDKQLRAGLITLDEGREDIGRDPLPDGAGKRNLVYTASGVTPIDKAIENADNPPQPQPLPGAPGQQGKEPPPKDDKKQQKADGWRKKHYA